MPSILQIQSLSKTYHRKPVLTNVIFTLDSKSQTGLIGDNGSGKTTLFKIISGIIRPQTGTGKLLDFPLFTSDFKYRKHLIFWSHDPMLYPALSGLENLKLFLSLRNQTYNFDTIIELSKKNGISDHIYRPVREYSVGQIQRLKLLQLSISNWQIALLDEPTAGMDLNSVKLLESKLSEWKSEGRAVFMTSHQKEWLSEWTDKILMIQNNQLLSKE